MAELGSSPRLLPLLVLLLLGAVAAVLLLLLTLPARDVHDPPGLAYGIVLDAGSSHTTLYIYKWPADKQNGTGLVTQHTECHVEGGGISSYAGQQGAAARSLEVCLNQAMADIPTQRHRLTPVYLGATAGMRLLQLWDPDQAAQILRELGHMIHSYPFSYRGASVLSGREEGAYGWVTVNYLQENFIKYGLVGRWLSPGRPTVGALDLGGASTQITFATREEVEDGRDGMKLRLYGKEYSLYTHSFLCYGRDQVLKRLLAHLVKTQGSREVLHPCFPADHDRSVPLGSIFNSPCTATMKPDALEPEAYVRVRGRGHYEQCVGNVSQIFSFQACPFSRCSFDKVFQPNISGGFMAFSAFFYTHSFLQRVTGLTVDSPARLDAAARTVCNMSLSQMILLAEDQLPRLHEYCACSVFLNVLMLRGYGFDDASFPGVSFQKKAGDTSVGWALGYMLTLSNLLPAESGGLRKALSVSAWGALICLCSLLLAAALLFILHRSCDRGGSLGGSRGAI